MLLRTLVASTLAATLLACSGSPEQGGEPTVSEDPLGPTVSALTFRPSQVADVKRCEMSYRADCADVDRDGLTDAWEDAILAHFEPRLEFDEQEKALHDDGFRMGVAARVVARADDPSRVVVFFGFAFSEDYGSCGFTDHHGDLERAVIELLRTPGTNGEVTLVRAYTAAHEGDPTDKSHTYEGDRLNDLEFVDEDGAPRWLLYTSRNKHATYANKKSCESTKWPCVADYCAASNMKNRNDYRRLLPFLNAGEPDHPIDSDWSEFGYTGVDAWSTKSFCGTASGGDCDSAPRGTFLHDPFTKKDI